VNASRRTLFAFAGAAVFVGGYLGAYLIWRHANGQTFEEYQSYEPGMVAPEHAGEWLMGAIATDSAFGRFFIPLIWVDEKWFTLVVVGE
jgi:hypothetical protein